MGPQHRGRRGRRAGDPEGIADTVTVFAREHLGATPTAAFVPCTTALHRGGRRREHERALPCPVAGCRGAAAWVLACTARCEHAQSVVGQARPDQHGARDRLADAGDNLLELSPPDRPGGRFVSRREKGLDSAIPFQ